jgi:RNA-binding protein|tara:strand:+ start:111 stop:410 length:300 start_codon:yes stop_codon:yes gene_type:complete
MPLTAAVRKEYRTLGHKLKPVVTIAGNGLSENVQGELNRALNDHELIKVKLMIEDRDLRKQVTHEMCQQLNCELVQTIGKIALILREAKNSKPHLTNLR